MGPQFRAKDSTCHAEQLLLTYKQLHCWVGVIAVPQKWTLRLRGTGSATVTAREPGAALGLADARVRAASGTPVPPGAASRPGLTFPVMAAWVEFLGEASCLRFS